MFDNKNIAFVYDWIDKWGGAERILLQLHQLFPQADYYTSCFDLKNASWAKDLKIIPSFIQSFPTIIKKNRILSIPFFPYAFESFNFGAYDIVISVTSSYAKSIITKPETLHICYLLTPTRYLWIDPKSYSSGYFTYLITTKYINNLKKWDVIAAQRPDKIVSISNTVRERCKKYYKRESEVIYPGFDIEYWNKVKSEKLKVKSYNSKLKIINNKKYYLIVSRLEVYKKVGLVVDVFNQLENENLVIVGKGTEKRKLMARAGKNIYFFEDLSDIELGYLYFNAQALIIPQEEDFGYVALEAQLMGCPVIAYNKGGATETILEEKTGIFFNKQNIASIKQALERFTTISYNLKQTVKVIGPENVQKFSKLKFIYNFKKLL